MNKFKHKSYVWEYFQINIDKKNNNVEKLFSLILQMISSRDGHDHRPQCGV